MICPSALLPSSDNTPVDSSRFTCNLEEFVSSIPPDLWEMMNDLTISKCYNHGWKQTQSHVHEREVRIAYLLCVFMFCASGGHCSVHC